MTVAATIGTAPLLAFHFEQVSLASLPANLLAAPAVAPIMWLGMLSAAAAQVSPSLAAPLNALDGPLLAYLGALARAAGAAPGRGPAGADRLGGRAGARVRGAARAGGRAAERWRRRLPPPGGPRRARRAWRSRRRARSRSAVAVGPSSAGSRLPRRARRARRLASWRSGRATRR